MKFKVKLITHNSESSMTLKKEIDDLSVSVISENISMLKIEEISEASAKSIIMDDDDILVDFGEINFDESIRFKIYADWKNNISGASFSLSKIMYDAHKFKEDNPELFDKHLREFEQLKNDYLKSKNKFFKNHLDKSHINRWNNNIYNRHDPSDYEYIFLHYYKPLKNDIEFSRTKKIEESEKDTADRLKKKTEELKAKDIEQYKEKVELLRSKGWSFEYRKEDSDQFID